MNLLPEALTLPERKPMNPTIGGIVHYKLSASDAEQINRRRQDWVGTCAEYGGPPGDGYQAHAGNSAAEGEVCPAVVVRTFGGTSANLQVWLDGSDSFWATSRGEGDGPGTWAWPTRT